MDAKLKPVNRVYEDIDPQIEWAYEEGLDTVIVHLPEFRKEQLKVEIASTGNIRVSGQRSLGNNKWKRFVKEIPIPSNVDNNAIHANFQENILYIKLPKVIAPAPKPRQQTKPRVETPPIIPQQKPTSEPKPQVAGVQVGIVALQCRVMMFFKRQQKAETSITRVSERQGEKNEPIDANKKKSIETDADNVSQENLEKERSGWFEKTGEVTSSSTSEKHGNIFETVRDALMMMDKGARGNEDGSGKYVVEGYKQVVGGMATELKKTNLINLVVAGLLVLVLALYVKNALFKTVFNEDK
uniref:SHSP domain-containing protein n=1 Tax=Fagus sylvatica TaxID=28930 RepID=A0A2N9FX36_FAGSY